MRKQEIEAKAIDCVRHVLTGGTVEDDLVECKAAWPDPKKAARRIAGHANSASEDSILWIIGVDEDRHLISDLPHEDPADWWSQVSRSFDGTPPELTILRVSIGEQAIHALAFTTDRAPYVVTTSGAEGISREVPWRSATGIRSAHREELLRILVADAQVPHIEFIETTATMAYLKAGKPDPEMSVNIPYTEDQFYIKVSGAIYLESRRPVMIPAHKWDSFLLFTNFKTGIVTDFQDEVTFGYTYNESAAHTRGVSITPAGLYIETAGMIGFTGRRILPVERRRELVKTPIITARMKFGISGTNRIAQPSVQLYRRKIKAEYSHELNFEWSQREPDPAF